MQNRNTIGQTNILEKEVMASAWRKKAGKVDEEKSSKSVMLT
jgi:hypothetical protein